MERRGRPPVATHLEQARGRCPTGHNRYLRSSNRSRRSQTCQLVGLSPAATKIHTTYFRGGSRFCDR